MTVSLTNVLAGLSSLQALPIADVERAIKDRLQDPGEDAVAIADVLGVIATFIPLFAPYATEAALGAKLITTLEGFGIITTGDPGSEYDHPVFI